MSWRRLADTRDSPRDTALPRFCTRQALSAPSGSRRTVLHRPVQSQTSGPVSQSQAFIPPFLLSAPGTLPVWPQGFSVDAEPDLWLAPMHLAGAISIDHRAVSINLPPWSLPAVRHRTRFDVCCVHVLMSLDEIELVMHTRVHKSCL